MSCAKTIGYTLSLLLARNGVKSQFVFTGELRAACNAARQGRASETRWEANAWAFKTRQTEGARARASESHRKRREAVGNVGKPSETSEAVENIRKPSETSGSRRKRREVVRNVRKTSGI